LSLVAHSEEQYGAESQVEHLLDAKALQTQHLIGAIAQAV
jgi:hypothetical protein